jgi:2,5-diamino-6-(ribosylamino)-4(3H)-pyrimidinone 5'-phosphate reductase
MRPYVIVNVAVSADGKLSTRERRQVKISGKQDFERVDELKASCDAVMVGIGTVLADDPSLTVKSPERISARVKSGRSEHPVRIVVDSNARTPHDAKILHKGSGKRVIAVAESAHEDVTRSLSYHADIIRAGNEKVDLTLLLEALYQMNIRSLMVEGGGTLIWSLLSAGLVDELFVFTGKIIIGGFNAPTLADGQGFIKETDFPRLECIRADVSEDGILIHWKVQNFGL